MKKRRSAGKRRSLSRRKTLRKAPSRQKAAPPSSPIIFRQPRHEAATPAAPVPSSFKDLPSSYGKTELVLLIRDPYWAFSYWDFSAETWNQIQSRLAGDRALKPMIRVHDLDAGCFFDLFVSLEAKNWYLHLGTPGHRYTAELGLGGGNSSFYVIVRSNEVRTPRDSPSDQVDKEWDDRDFQEIYRLSGGGRPGLSSPGSLFSPRPL